MNISIACKTTFLIAVFYFSINSIFAQSLEIRFNDTPELHTMIEPLNTNFNTFLGENAGRINIGASNTFIGNNAGAANTDGEFNTFLGQNAGLTNTTGASNTFIGRNSGAANTVGLQNIFIGTNAGAQNIDADFNTFIGSFAGLANTTGTSNTFLGQAAGNINTTGSNNTYLGRNAGTNSTGSGNLFLGSNAGANELGSNRLYMSNSNADADNALIYGEFDNSLLRFNADVEITAADNPTLMLQSNGVNEESGRVSLRQSNNTGADLLYDGESSSDLFAIETFTGGTSNGRKFTVDLAGHVGINQNNSSTGLTVRSVTGDVFIFNAEDTNGNDRFTVTADGHVGVNQLYSNVALNIRAIAGDNNVFSVENTSGNSLFSVAPNGNAVLAGTLTQNSDRRLKKNIIQISKATEGIQQLAGYRYNWIAEQREKETQIGVIAQELQAVYPELVKEDEEGILSVNYSGLSAILIEAVKEQQEQMDIQEISLAKQQDQIDALMIQLGQQTAAFEGLMSELKEIRKESGSNTTAVLED